MQVSSNSDSLEERVFACVAEMTRAPRHALGHTTDLYRDLALTGPEARNLLAALAEEFDIDLSGIRFYRHFDNGGFSLSSPNVLWTIMGAVLFAMTSVPAASYLTERFDLPYWGNYVLIGLCIPLVLVWMQVGSLIFPRPRDWSSEKIPVTIQDLISAAKEKKWPINYEGRYTS
ncbi:hypothetical protein [Hyphomicrobium sp.]|uniref:hypothetical protein n=1 Tax=Hyphomicrobium sp. TaxID=82 RepID=UPI002FE37B74